MQLIGNSNGTMTPPGDQLCPERVMDDWGRGVCQAPRQLVLMMRPTSYCAVLLLLAAAAAETAPATAKGEELHASAAAAMDHKWPFGRLLNHSSRFTSRYWQRDDCLHLPRRGAGKGKGESEGPTALLSSSQLDWLVFTAVGLSSVGGQLEDLSSSDITLSRRRPPRKGQKHTPQTEDGNVEDEDEDWSEQLDWERALHHLRQEQPQQGPGWWLSPSGHNNLLKLAHNACARGFSLIVHGANRRWRALGDAASLLSTQLGHPVNANVYLTPAGEPGFGGQSH